MRLYKLIDDAGAATTMTEQQVFKLAASWIDDINYMEPEGSPYRWEYPQDFAQTSEVVTEYLNYEMREYNGI